MRQGKYRFIVGMLAAPVILYAVFVIGPYGQAFYIAMTNWRGISGTPEFIGLDNFRTLVDDDVFWDAVRNHIVILLALPLATLAIALFFAFLLNIGGGSRAGAMTGVRGAGVYKVIFFLPQVLAVAVLGVLFQTVYRADSPGGPQSGVINGLLDKVGLGPVQFLSDSKYAIWSVIGVLVWQAVGFYVVLFSAGMSSIPKDVFEAAALDGAGRGKMFFRITLPLLWDTLQVAWVYLGIMAFDCFAIVQTLTVEAGGPNHSTTVLAVETWRNAFTYSKFGYASAMGVALFFLTITFAALTLRVTRRERIEF